jgi:hypothetical protein
LAANLNYESKVKSRVRSGEFANEFANASEYVGHCIRVAEAGEDTAVQLYRVEPDLTCPPGGESVLESVQLLDLALDSLLALPGNHTQG